jgi:hypothetical protein
MMGNILKTKIIFAVIAGVLLLFLNDSAKTYADNKKSPTLSTSIEFFGNTSDGDEAQQMKENSDIKNTDLSKVNIQYGPRGIPISIDGQIESYRVDDVEALYTFLDGIKDVMKLLDPEKELKVINEDHDEFGTIYHLSQYHDELLVYGCYMTVVVNQLGFVIDVTANLIPDISQSEEPLVSQETAIKTAIGIPGKQSCEAILVFFAGNDTLGDVCLCWMVLVENGDDAETSGYKFIDANSGVELGFKTAIIF